jgi:hypothetical protein
VDEVLAGPIVQRTAAGMVLLAGVVQWEHRRSGQAHCLGRLIAGPARKVVGVLSELRSNRYGLGVSSDAGGAATALLRLPVTADALSLAIPGAAAEVAWLLHHGAFSSYDNPDAAETFTLAEDMHWGGSRYRDDIGGHRLLAVGETAVLFAGISLETVPEVLARLGWRS